MFQTQKILYFEEMMIEITRKAKGDYDDVI